MFNDHFLVEPSWPAPMIHRGAGGQFLLLVIIMPLQTSKREALTEHHPIIPEGSNVTLLILNTGS